MSPWKPEQHGADTHAAHSTTQHPREVRLGGPIGVVCHSVRGGRRLELFHLAVHHTYFAVYRLSENNIMRTWAQNMIEYHKIDHSDHSGIMYRGNDIMYGVMVHDVWLCMT